jgi:hypothetical protein
MSSHSGANMTTLQLPQYFYFLTFTADSSSWQYLLIPAAIRNITTLAAGSVIISVKQAVPIHPCSCQENNILYS